MVRKKQDLIKKQLLDPLDAVDSSNNHLSISNPSKHFIKINKPTAVKKRLIYLIDASSFNQTSDSKQESTTELSSDQSRPKKRLKKERTEDEIDKLITRRLHQFESAGCLEKKGQQIYCRVCKCAVKSYQRKHFLEYHLKSKQHLKFLEQTEEFKNKHSNSMNCSEPTPEEINRETILLFEKLKIPLRKLDEPAFKKYAANYIKSGSLIVNSTVAKKNLKAVYQSVKQI